MRVYTVASSYVGYGPDGSLVTHEGAPFSPDLYSRMKYGSQSAARTLGVELGSAILRQVPGLVLDTRPLVALLTYKYVPSAAATITRAATCLLSEARLAAGLSDVQHAHVVTGKVLGRDYSSLDEAGRAAYIAETGYFLRQEDVDGANVIVVDDIRNTGAAEDLVFRFTADKGIENLVLAYVGIMNQEDARRDPSVERKINTSSITDLTGLLEIIDVDGMTLTIRTMKMVLGQKDTAALEAFLRKIPEQLLFELFQGTLGSGPEFVDYYADGLAVVRKIANERYLLPTTR